MSENRISGFVDQFGFDRGMPISGVNLENFNEMLIVLDSRESDDSGGCDFTLEMQMHQIKQFMINKTYQAQIEISSVCREEIY